MSLQNIIIKLQEFWSQNGCYIASGYDTEVGAGTMTPDTFFRVLGKKHWEVAFWQPSRRPDDGRYAKNPNRVQKGVRVITINGKEVEGNLLPVELLDGENEVIVIMG